MSTTNWTQVAGMTGDVEVENVQDYAETATEKAAEASASASAAAASASSASTSASSATSSASSATSSETNAATSASNAATSATSASGSATTATTKASEAATSASNASTSETNAATSETNAANSATSASTSASNASTSATNAASSETNAATSASNASTSETNAATSETNAASSASSASTSASNASTSETNAASSASSASTSATNAATSETNAGTSETNAATSASSASTSASQSATSATQAAASAASAASALDNFDDRYLGAKTADPALDNDGDALVVGALYFNTTDGVMRIYTASGWINASSSSVATMQKYRFTATSGQTVFSGADDDAETLSITVGAELVTLNGVVLEVGTDYTVTSSSITLTSGATTSDELNVYAFGNFLVADTVSASTGGTFQAEVTFDGGAAFNDNDKATFGAGDDLQIYHDSTNSYIVDSGTGTLNLRSSDTIRLQTSDGAGGWQNVFAGVDEGAAFLYYDGSDRLQTTSTGVYANLSLSIRSSSSPSGYNLHVSQDDSDKALAKFTNTTTGTTATDGFDVGINATEEAIVWHHESKPIRFGTNSTDRLLIENDGDISFYEDTGTTAKFFWDASAESLGIGTTSPVKQLTLASADTSTVVATALNHGASNYWGVGSYTDQSFRIAKSHGLEDVNTYFAIERSTGNVGIGTSSPSDKLHVYQNAVDNVLVKFENAANNAGNLVQFSQVTNGSVAAPIFYVGHGGDSTGDAVLLNASNTNMKFSTNNTERLRIDSSGNVGINCDPDFKLEVEEAGTGSGLGGIASSTATAGGNAGYRWVTGGTTRFGMTTIGSAGSESLRIYDNNNSSTRLTLDSSGNLLVGKTATGGGTTTGTQLNSDGYTQIVRDSTSTNPTLYLGKLTNDGEIVRFTKDGSTVGSIYSNAADGGSASELCFASGNTGLKFDDTNNYIRPTNSAGALRDNIIDLGEPDSRFKDLYLSGGVYAEDYILAASGSTFSIYPKSGATSHNTFLYCQKSDGVNVGGGFDNGYAGAFRPSTDNAQDLGGSSHRWDDVYATNATIQTSDRNEKQDIEELSDAEQRVALAAKGLLRKYRWINSVEEKGDDARIHFGIIAQDLEDAFTAEGLDAGRYAMFIHNEWWESEVTIPAVEEQTDEDGNVIVQAEPERTEIQRYNSESDAPEGAVYKERRGIRYNQLLAFIIAAI